MPTYAMGDPTLDRLIDDLIDATGDGANDELIGELITTALKLYRDQPDRGELKLFNTALKEMRYSALVFSAYRDRKKVTIFGSARAGSDDPSYRLTYELARKMAEEQGWMVITGAGPGIMEAGNRGAGLEHSFGVNIRLPFEAEANGFIDPKRVINFKYFFTRKLGFVKESHAFAVFPGGFGTMDEAFELLTLVQTGKADIYPILLIEPEGSSYWETWLRFVESQLLHRGMISEHDLALFKITSDLEDAIEEMTRFYRNYHSQRYVDGILVLRLHRAPRPEELAALSDEFADLLVSGRIEAVAPSPAEVEDRDALHCERVSLHFDRRQFGRLRQLIDRLNDLVTAPPDVVDPVPPVFSP